MKAFFSKLHLGSSTQSKNEKDLAVPAIQKEKFPPLRQWPPPPAIPTEQVQRSSSQHSSSSSSAHSNVSKPLPEVMSKERETPTPTSTPTPTPTPTQPEPEPAIHPVRKTATNSSLNSDVQKRVAFLSPPQSPAPLLDTVSEAEPSPVPPLKTNVSRFQAAQSSGKNSPYSSVQSLRSGTPYSQMSGISGMSATSGSGSRILAATSWSEVTEEDLVSNLGSRERTRQEVLFEIISSEERYVQELAKMKETFIEPLLHPYSSGPSRVVSPISSTPNLDSYDYDYSAESSDHLPPIAARFMSPTPSAKDSTPNIDGESMDTDDEDKYKRSNKHNHPRSPYRASAAPKKTVPFPTRSHHSLPPLPRGNPNAVSTQSLGRQSIIYEHERERSQSQIATNTGTVARGMLRKLRRDSNAKDNSSAVFGDAVPAAQLPEDLRICLEAIDSGGVFDGHKRLSEALKKRYDDQYPLVRSLADVFVANSDIFHGYATYVLHLERALEQVDNALSTADPSSSNSKSSSSKSSAKSPSKSPYPLSTPASAWPRIVSLLHKLEVTAAEKGETGLAITLSKPFQRLLKYPLLFQNLLYHTDPSTYEYESTLQMVAEVESIVRSIEDEKIIMEERDRTRDCWARIEGLEKVKSGRVVLPKPSRVLVEERQYIPPGTGTGTHASPLAKSTSMINGATGNGSASPPPPSVMANKPIRGKSSLNFKRLSDALSPTKSASSSGSPSPYSKKDLWLVMFNDVVLLCQRTGTTSLPLVTSTSVAGVNGRTTSLPELTAKSGKGEKDSKGRRGSFTKPRNLYKFIKIENWAMGEGASSNGTTKEGVVSMEDMVRSRTQQLSNQPKTIPKIIPMPADDDDDVPKATQGGDSDDDDSDDSDRKSKMSFSYWGADKVTVQKPIKPSVVRGAGRGGRTARGGVRVVPSRRGGAGPSTLSPAYARESSANAKFGTRLVSGEGSSNGHGNSQSSHGHSQPRPASRRTGGTTGRTTPTSSTARNRVGTGSSPSAPSNFNSTSGPAPSSEDMKATVTRPGWNSNPNPRAQKMSTSASAGARSRNVSQSGSTRSPAPVAASSSAGREKALSPVSPAPSEDSGVVLYRQYHENQL